MVSSGAHVRACTSRKTRSIRLDAAAWIAAGFDALADGGIDAVRVEPLAKSLAITKGSFYWHFADRRALIDAMLAAWTDGRIAAIRQQTERGEPAAVLRTLADLYTRHANLRGLTIELAIRSLARTDSRPPKRCATSIASGCSMSASCSPGSAGRARRRRRARSCSTAICSGRACSMARPCRPLARDKAVHALIAAP